MAYFDVANISLAYILQNYYINKFYTLLPQICIKINRKCTMKQIYLTFSLFLAGLLLLTNMFAQNVMFVGFNKTYEDVVAELQAMNVQEIELEKPSQPLTAYYDGFVAEYYFNHRHRLYKVEVKKNYDRTHEMKEAVKGAMEYFDMISEDVEHIPNTKDKSQMTRVNLKDRKFEMEITTFARNDTEVIIRGIDSEHAPSQAYMESHAAR